MPRLLRVAFPLARFRRKLYGIDHIAVQFESVERLLANYERLRRSGISPVWSINHGPTTSLYYEDPDSIRLEFQTDNFPTVATAAAYFESGEFVANPIGTEIDPDFLLKRLRNGDDPADLLKPGAGTPPGTKARANKRAITWKHCEARGKAARIASRRLRRGIAVSLPGAARVAALESLPVPASRCAMAAAAAQEGSDPPTGQQTARQLPRSGRARLGHSPA